MGSGTLYKTTVDKHIEIEFSFYLSLTWLPNLFGIGV